MIVLLCKLLKNKIVISNSEDDGNTHVKVQAIMAVDSVSFMVELSNRFPLRCTFYTLGRKYVYFLHNRKKYFMTRRAFKKI